MGKGIVYCSVCGARILESHFKQGGAITFLTKNYCSTCAKDVDKLKSETQDTPSTTGEPPSPRRLETRRVPLANSPRRPGGKLPIQMPLIVAIVIGLIALLLLIIVLSRDGH